MTEGTDRTPEPYNTEPPHIPNADIYDTHRRAEWIAITDSVYADVVNAAMMGDYQLNFVGLPDGRLWIHVKSGWGYQ